MDNNSKVPIKAKNVMYTQQLKYLPAGGFDEVIELIKTKIVPKRFAAIIHDKDVNDKGELEEEHLHVMMSFENARSINSIANLLGDKPQYVEIWSGESSNGYSYLIHATDNAQNKYQYKATEVRSNFDYISEIQRIKQKIQKKKSDANINSLLDAMYDGLITKSEVEAVLTGSQYGKNKRQIDYVWMKSLQKKAEHWRKEMISSGKSVSVIWIFGEAGTGKTSLAKEYAKKMNRDFFITGSSRDLFQGYEGQHTIIFDEFRPRYIEYSDLLRITDPFGSENQIMAPSRYADKAIACDLYIITSPYSPTDFYRELLGVNGNFTWSQLDSFEQLQRRITLAMFMTDEKIYMASYDKKYHEYCRDDSTEKENKYSKKVRGISSEQVKNLYNSIVE